MASNVKKIGIIATIVAVVLAAAGGGYYFLAGPGSQDGSDPKAVQTTQDKSTLSEAEEVNSDAQEGTEGDAIEQESAEAGSTVPVELKELPKKLDKVHIGRIVHLSGSATGMLGEGEPKPLKLNEELFPSQTIATEAGASVIVRYRDGSTFYIGPDSSVTLDRFVFNPSVSRTDNQVKVKQGSFRYISGFSVKRSNVALSTPKASLGVRGTTVEGVVHGDVPTLLSVPEGYGALSNDAGSVEVGEGDSTSVLAKEELPADPKNIPVEVTYETIQFLQKELGLDENELPELTSRQLYKDAVANMMSIEDQDAAAMRLFDELDQQGQSDDQAKQDIKSPDQVLAELQSMVPGRLLSSVADAFGNFTNSISFVSTAMAATVEQIQNSLALLIEAKSAGFLRPKGEQLTPQQQDAQKKFKEKAEKKYPDAKNKLAQHNKKQKDKSKKKKKKSSKNVIKAASAVAATPKEVAKLVGQAIQAAKQLGLDMSADLVAGALGVDGTTNTTEMATAVMAAAVKADPDGDSAYEMTKAALDSLPAANVDDALTKIASAAAQASPESAAAVAKASVEAGGDGKATEIAAAVSFAAKDQAADIAKAITEVAGPEQAAQIAATVTKTAGEDAAGAVAKAVTEAAGKDAASEIAAAVTQIAGAEKAGEIAMSVTLAAGKEAAADIAASVTQVTNGEGAADIAKAVTTAAGKEAAADIAASITQVAGEGKAAEIAKSVTEATNGEAASDVAAAVTQVAGADAAASIAKSVTEASTPEQAKSVAAAVTSVAGAEKAADIAKSVTEGAGAEQAASIAAAVTQVASTQDGGAAVVAAVAKSVTEATNGEAAAGIAAAVTEMAGADQAAAIAQSVTEGAKSSGVDASTSIAAAVTEVAGAEKAGDIASSVTSAAGPEAAGNVAAAVTMVAGDAAAASVNQAVATASGQDAAAVQQQAEAAKATVAATVQEAQQQAQQAATAAQESSAEIKQNVDKAAQSASNAQAVASQAATKAKTNAQSAKQSASVAESTTATAAKTAESVTQAIKDANAVVEPPAGATQPADQTGGTTGTPTGGDAATGGSEPTTPAPTSQSDASVPTTPTTPTTTDTTTDTQFDPDTFDSGGTTDSAGGSSSSSTTSTSSSTTSTNTAPVMDSGGPFTVEEGAEAGTAVGTVLATDAEGEAITYSIISGNADGFFEVSASGGAITVTSTGTSGLDYETTATYTLGIQATDSVKTSESESFIIYVSNVNEAPTITVPAAQTGYEDAELSISGISISDVDAGTATVQVQLTVTAGIVTIGTLPSDVSVSSGANGSATVTLQGSLTNLNTALGTLSYTGTGNNAGSDVLTVTVSDLGNSGTGSAETATGTVTITSSPVGDTPTVTSVTTTEDTQSGLITITRNSNDSTEVDAFILSDFIGGTLTKSDGATAISDGSSITNDEAAAGVKFTPSADRNDAASFKVKACASASDTTTCSSEVTSTITITPVGDTPSVASATTYEDAQSSAITISRNTSDGTEVTHFKITSISGGTLYKSDGTTAISANSYITYAEGTAGVKFTPTADSTTSGSFSVQSSEDGTTVAAQSDTVATSTITITPVGDTPTVGTGITTDEETQSGAVTITKSGSDGADITLYYISNIVGGTLYKSDGTTQVTEGSTVTIAEGASGLKITPETDRNTAVTFDVQAAGSASDTDTFSTAVTASVSINAIGDTPSTSPTSITTLEDTQSSAITINRNTNDSTEVTHFEISSITNGTLYQNDGTTSISEGAYITYDQGQAGLKFTPSSNSSSSGSFKVRSSQNGTSVAAQSDYATVTITVTSVADTPTVASVTTTEDTQSGLITITKNTSDGSEVTQYEISNIINGSVYKSDGTTAVTTGTFVTVAEGTAGLKFTPDANSTTGSFDVKAVVDSTDSDTFSSAATSTITITPVGDTPQVADITTLEDTQSGGIVISRNANDGTEVTHFKISNIVGGTLYKNDGTTAISDGSYITFDEGNAGVKFTPSSNRTTAASFQVQSSEDGSTVSAQSTTAATSTITITAVGDTPTVDSISTDEDSLSGLITMARNSEDGTEVTHFRINSISNGTLYKSDGTTQITDETFITYDEGTTGVKFMPTADSTTSGTFTVESSEDGTTVASQSSTATSTITINAVNDGPTVSYTIGSITENSADGTSVSITNNTSDPEGDTIASYEIVNGTTVATNSNSTFTIDSSTGAISVATGKSSDLDYETTQTFTLTIKASDNFAGPGLGPQPGTGTADVTINLTDLNDNAPVLATGGPYSVNEDAAADTVIATITATDPDSTTNSGTSFDITAGNTDGYFSIDASTGELKVSSDGAATGATGLNYNVTSSYTLTVRARDTLDLSLSSTQDYVVNLTFNDVGASTIPDRDTIMTNAKTVYEAVKESLDASTAYTLTESDLRWLILGKLAQQITGSSTVSLSNTLEEISVDIKTPAEVTVTLKIAALDLIYSRLPSGIQGDSSTSGTFVNLFGAVTSYSGYNYYADVRIRVVPTVSSGVVSFDTSKSYVSIYHDTASTLPDLSFSLSSLIDNYNSVVVPNLSATDLHFFTGSTRGATAVSSSIPSDYSQDLDYYFPGTISSVTFNDGSITLTP
ncbi:MAG: cadherin domain-containing protein [Magnetococcales bacterium]|nr:cadherin domain-containing protein [Magnetococcales bacterium]